jgi:hypothetical protein
MRHSAKVKLFSQAYREASASPLPFRYGSGGKAPCTNSRTFLQEQSQLLPHDHLSRAFQTWDRQINPFSFGENVSTTFLLAVERSWIIHRLEFVVDRPGFQPFEREDANHRW